METVDQAAIFRYTETMPTEGSQPEDFIRRKLPHREAGSVLEFLQTPELLEASSLADVRRALQRFGYTEQKGEVTMGWGRVVDRREARTPTQVLFFEQGTHRLMYLAAGSQGTYSLRTYVPDTEHLSAEERQHLAVMKGEFHVETNYGITQRVREFFNGIAAMTLDEYKAAQAQQQGSRWRIWKLFRRKRKGE